MVKVAQLNMGRAEMVEMDNGEDTRNSPPAYPGIAVHYTPSRRKQYQQHHKNEEDDDDENDGEEHTPLRPLCQRVAEQQHKRVPSIDIPHTPIRTSSSHQGFIPVASLSSFEKDTMRRVNHHAVDNEDSVEKYLFAKLVKLYSTVQREYHMHNLVQSFYSTIHFYLFYIPSALLLLAGGTLSLTMLVYDENDPVRKERSFWAGMLIFGATIWNVVSNQLRFSSRSIVHRHTAEELRKLLNRLKRRHDDRVGNWSSSMDFAISQGNLSHSTNRTKLTKHEMVVLQQLYDQILPCCHSQLPYAFVQTFNYMDVRIRTLLGSLYDDNINVQWWLMPLVYESLAGTIRETITWPLIFWNAPRWYVERSLDNLLKPNSLPYQLDLESGELEDHPLQQQMESESHWLFFCWKTKNEGSKLQRLINKKSGRESMLFGTRKMQNMAYRRGGGDRKTDSYSSSNEEKMEVGEILMYEGDYSCRPQAETPTTQTTQPSSRGSSFRTNPFGDSPPKWERSLGMDDSSSIESNLIPSGISPTGSHVSSSKDENEGSVGSTSSPSKVAMVKATDTVDLVEQIISDDDDKQSLLLFSSGSHSDGSADFVNKESDTAAARLLLPSESSTDSANAEIMLESGAAKSPSKQPSSTLLYGASPSESIECEDSKDSSDHDVKDTASPASPLENLDGHSTSNQSDDDEEEEDMDEEDHLSPYKVAVKRVAGNLSSPSPEELSEMSQMRALMHSPVGNGSVGSYSVGTAESEDDDSAILDYPAAAGGGFPVAPTTPQNSLTAQKTNLLPSQGQLSPIVSCDGTNSESTVAR